MENENKTTWLERPIHPALPAITNELAIFAGIIIIAFLTRFFNLEARVMSHDESLHTYFSWLLYRGQGYQHTPMMHGPFQFHILALTYFIFGVSDLTARIPAVLFSIATVWMVWYWRRYLGNWGALAAGIMMVLSPYMLYYGRYVRNELYAGFAGILLLYAILRYMETGGKRYLYMLTLATVLHFTAKETAFIYTAQALLFLGFYFISRITRKPWEENPGLYRVFIIILAAVVLLGGFGLGLGYLSNNSGTLAGAETVVPANPTGTTSPLEVPSAGIQPGEILLGLALIGVLAGIYVLFRGYGWRNILKERSFDLMLLLFTFVLPMLSAFLLDIFKSTLQVTIPTDAASVNGLDARALGIIGAIMILLFVLSIAIGMFWNRDWWKYAVLFWGIFTILYTTVFTNAAGFFTGAIGSLGYWLVQQGVERGSQPMYYYWLIQIPLYEFLPALGTIVAIIVGAIKLYKQEPAAAAQEPANLEALEPALDVDPDPIDVDTAPVEASNFGLFYGLMTWWCITSVVAFTVAGERMPWLTYHMAWPMVLFTGWVVGVFIDTLVKQWTTSEKPGQMVLSILVLTVFILALFNSLRALFGATPPFQGTDLVQLQATASFLVPLAVAILSGALLAYMMKDDLVSLAVVVLFILALVTFVSSIINGASLLSFAGLAGADTALTSASWLKLGTALVALIGSIVGILILSRLQRGSAFISLFVLTVFSLLLLQTARTSFRANYVLYDDAMEYLVYAHGATGVKDVMKQVEEVSKRTAGGLNAIIAYDASAPDTGVSWPMVWYLRDYTAQRSFDKPTRSLREAVAVIVDQKNFEQIEGALGDEFYRFDYIRMWWPNQDYFNLDRSRVLNAITNPQIRDGIFDIWFKRDYTKYAQATGSTAMTLTTWSPADQMRLYIRKDIASKIWNYGVGPSQAPVAEDPYKAGTIILPADQIFGSERYQPLGLNAPRGIASGLNGDLYVADSRNHRILHIAEDGSLLQEWGSFADIATGNAPQGTFNEPWGVAVGPDGSVYVTDTWNHRVQKFSESGDPIKTWGQYGQPFPDVPESKSSFWGPRGIAVDQKGQVYVADTGNKRIVVFDSDGNYLTEFGTAGFEPGQFDEPVGVAVGNDGVVYVTDTWNQRIQSFTPGADGLTYLPLFQWDVNGWFGQSLENKPFIAVGDNNHVFITDPEGYRVIEFTSDGQFVRTWGDFGTGEAEIGLAAGVRCGCGWKYLGHRCKQ